MLVFHGEGKPLFYWLKGLDKISSTSVIISYNLVRFSCTVLRTVLQIGFYERTSLMLSRQDMVKIVYCLMSRTLFWQDIDKGIHISTLKTCLMLVNSCKMDNILGFHLYILGR